MNREIYREWRKWSNEECSPRGGHSFPLYLGLLFTTTSHQSGRLEHFKSLYELFAGAEEWQDKYLNQRFSPEVRDSRLIAEDDNLKQTRELQTRFQAFKTGLAKVLHPESSLKNACRCGREIDC